MPYEIVVVLHFDQTIFDGRSEKLTWKWVRFGFAHTCCQRICSGSHPTQILPWLWHPSDSLYRFLADLVKGYLFREDHGDSDEATNYGRLLFLNKTVFYFEFFQRTNWRHFAFGRWAFGLGRFLDVLRRVHQSFKLIFEYFLQILLSRCPISLVDSLFDHWLRPHTLLLCFLIGSPWSDVLLLWPNKHFVIIQ